MNPTSLYFLFFNTSEDSHYLELMDYIKNGMDTFNLTGKFPATTAALPVPPVVSKILYDAKAIETLAVRNENGGLLPESISTGTIVHVYQELHTIPGGYTQRAVIDPPDTKIRRNVWITGIQKL